MKKIIKNIFIVVAILFFPVFTQAAELSMKQIPLVGEIGKPVSVTVYVDAQDSRINALQGEILLPKGVSVKTFDDAGTLVSAWIEKPTVREGRIVFSGIIPGGFRGLVTPSSTKLAPGILFRFTFTTDNQAVLLTPENVQFFERAGERVASIKLSPLFIKLNTTGEGVFEIKTPNDIYPPENFSIQLAKDEGIFNGQNFIVFSTTDAGTGVDFYSIQEGNRKPVSGDSPYLLQDQSLRGPIIVRAYDKAGNAREVILNVEGVNSVKYYIIISIILLVLVTYGLSSWKKRSSFFSK